MVDFSHHFSGEVGVGAGVGTGVVVGAGDGTEDSLGLEFREPVACSVMDDDKTDDESGVSSRGTTSDSGVWQARPKDAAKIST